MKQIQNPEVCVVGLGYVGLPLAVAFAEAGVDVIGFDVDDDKVASLAEGHSLIEDIADAKLAAVLATKLDVTSNITDIKPAAAYIICVPTPLKDSLPDLQFVESAGRLVGSVLEPRDLVVLESTTYPGTTEDFLAPLLTEVSGLDAGTDFDLAYSPERIDPGNETWTITTTPKVVGGCTERATERAVLLYSRVADAVVRASGPREAEMAKLLENTFRHVNIALINELAIFANTLGIDIWEVIRLAGTKPFGFMPFQPGPGVGGHCIPVDPSYLSWTMRRLGFQFRFVELAQEINDRMPTYVVNRMAELLNLRGLAVSRARILCVGVAYKKGVSDCRESPALTVLKNLRTLGADITYIDPYVPSVEVCGVRLESATAIEGRFDAAVVLTPHDEIDLEAVVAASDVVLDTRGAVPSAESVVRL
jgi:UDP-N-acetyl-D-glucosamine dehydrogenase